MADALDELAEYLHWKHANASWLRRDDYARWVSALEQLRAAPVSAPPAEPTRDVYELARRLRKIADPEERGYACNKAMEPVLYIADRLVDAAPAAEPVAQQPPPIRCEHDNWKDQCMRCAAAPAEAPRCECTGARIGYVAPRDGPIECGQCKTCRDYYASITTLKEMIADDAQEIARLDDLRAEWKDKANRNAGTSYALMDELDASRERERLLREALREAAARISEHEALLGKIAMAAVAAGNVRDLTCGLKVTFPDGSPHASLAAPDSVAHGQ